MTFSHKQSGLNAQQREEGPIFMSCKAFSFVWLALKLVVSESVQCKVQCEYVYMLTALRRLSMQGSVIH